MQDAWKQAFTLMADHGHLGAAEIVADGIREAREDQAAVHGWIAIAECLNAFALASRSKN